MKTNDQLHKIYAGFLGMNIGIRLGAPVEPTVWTSERIERFYGDITSYVKPFRNFAADDDANGPVFFLRALDDGALGRELTPQDVAQAWLNYCREGVGMFWWGGYGVSTEHTAYLNLINGIEAPRSGSAQVNGTLMSEQIGGQIFIDTWGLVCPSDPKRAASLAVTAASVSHDGEGLHGAAFIAACIAHAFDTDDIDEIVQVGLSVIPTGSLYAQVVSAVVDHHAQHPDDWRSCLAFLQKNWGYDRYGGVCHIIPNAGVCAMALVYGRSFARGVEIATMAGWDTDCNAGNVGTILGVAGGLASIPRHYRDPINDSIVLSGISGYLNILDIPTYARKLATFAHQLAGTSVPEGLPVPEGIVDFDFLLEGSTHCMRLSDPTKCSMRNVAGAGMDETNALEVLFDRMVRGQTCRVYYKPFYRREDFDDERYMPVFSPTAYPGQRVSMRVRLDRFGGESVILTPYVRNTSTKEIIPIGGKVYTDGYWHDLSWVIPTDDPRLQGCMVDEVGLLLEANSPAKNRDFGCLYIDRYVIDGKGDYSIAIGKQKKEFASVTLFSHNHGSWEIVDGMMEAMCLDHCEAMTGNYFMNDVVVEGSVTPHSGNSHLMSLCVQGAMKGYYGGLVAGGVAIFEHDGTLRQLAVAPFDWKHERRYGIQFAKRGDTLQLKVEGAPVLECDGATLDHGMVGYAMYATGRCGFGDLSVVEL